jgi:hypothetical protein
MIALIGIFILTNAKVVYLFQTAQNHNEGKNRNEGYS